MFTRTPYSVHLPAPSYLWVGQKVPLVFYVKIKDTFSIFTKNFTEQYIYHFVPLPSAIFQATSKFHLPNTFYFFEQRTVLSAFYSLLGN